MTILKSINVHVKTAVATFWATLGIIWTTVSSHCCGQSYKHFTLINYDSRVIPDWKIPHITTLES